MFNPYTLLAGALIVLLGLGWFGRPLAPDSGAFTVGAILPLTGDLASLGQEVRRGIELATADANVKGITVQVDYQDDQTLIATAVANAANKIVNIDHAQAGLTMIIEEARPAIPIFENARVPLLVLWDSNEYLKTAGQYVFSNGFSTEKAGQKMADYAFRTLHLTHVAVVGHADAWADIIGPAFISEFEKLGGTIVFNESVAVETTDYRSVIAKVKQVNPDGIYFPLIPPTSAPFLTQLKQNGVKAILLAGDAFTQDMIVGAGDAAEGVYLTNIYSFSDDPSGLSAKYEKQYGTVPFDLALLTFGYDGLNKLLEAGQKGGTFTSVGIKAGLDSLYGLERSPNREEKIYQVRGGIPVEVP